VFRKELCAAADAFPEVEDPSDHEREKHVTLFIHGYNTTWQEAVRRYRQICSALYSGRSSLGLCVLFTWPSDGLKIGYYPDRLDARRSADELAHVLATLYEHILQTQTREIETGQPHCRAKISIVAHSMGNYLVQKALYHVWTRKNQPLLLSLVNQLLMVAADVDNDLFRGGETIDRGEGDGIANLAYRVTSLYTGLDSTLGLSAGLKHFGKRRLGRSGLDDPHDVADNVWDVDCSQFFHDADGIHSAYFEVVKTQRLMQQVLRGVDRRVLIDRFGLRRTSEH
jgi:esterase/lipase superfamily enzyme